MQELLDTGLYKCVRQYAMEIHMSQVHCQVKNGFKGVEIYTD